MRRSAAALEVRVFRHLLVSVAEEMGAVLMRSAVSPNVKERLDFSAAITDGRGRMVAQASHIPVHLGSAHLTAQGLLSSMKLRPGDAVVLNDPFRGGTHLPDVTIFVPVFAGATAAPRFGIILRAHHADIGGASPGSMGPAADIHAEGLVIPPVRLVKGGILDGEILSLLLANVRGAAERKADLLAQLGAARRGAERLAALVARFGMARLLRAMRALRRHARRTVESLIATLPPGTFRASDTLDGKRLPARIAVTVRRAGKRLLVDFTGTGPAVDAPFNANLAITTSAVFYVIRLLVGEDVPTNSGCLEPVTITAPEGCLVNARYPAAVAGGNVETSQRIVDVLLAALARGLPGRVPAASQGTMNNLTLAGPAAGGGVFTFYETIAGGAGASPHRDGASGIHTHMTNTRNTPIEAIELACPLRVTAYGLRRGSGGAGRRRGGDGVIREFEALVPIRGALLATRRASRPPGLAGGGSGAGGADFTIRDGVRRHLPPVASFTLAPGDRVRVGTPGGGGHGRPSGADLLRETRHRRRKTKASGRSTS